MMCKSPFYYKRALRYSVSKTGSFPQSANTCIVQQVRRRNVTMTSSSLAWRQNWPFENSGTVKVNQSSREEEEELVLVDCLITMLV